MTTPAVASIARTVGCFWMLAVLLGGCEIRTSSSRSPQSPPPAQYPPGQAPPGQNPTASPTAQQPGPAQAPPSTPTASAYPPVLDPINNVDIVWLRNRAQAVYQQLIQALPAGPQGRIAGVPLVLDQEPSEVNAFATCTRSGKAFIAVTDGLTDIMAHLAQCRATDEVFGTRKTDEYVAFMAQNQKPGAPIVRPPLGFFNAQQHLDARKIARQHQLFAEAVGFVLAHEMGHHYLGHLPCTAGMVTAAEIGMVLSSAVPAFNQPAEVAADMGGTKNVLVAGMRQSDYHYTETGALLVMQFFGGMDQLSPIDIVFGFERSHPAPQVRSPIIQQTAATVRASGGTLPPVF